MAAALEKELAKFPERRSGASSATPATRPTAKRTAEQKKLLAAQPELNITAGVLYQYNQAAADELKKDAGEDRRRSGPRSRSRTSSACSTRCPASCPRRKLFHRGDHRQPTQAGRRRAT